MEEEIESFSEKGVPCKAGKLTSQQCFLREPEGPLSTEGGTRELMRGALASLRN